MPPPSSPPPSGDGAQPPPYPGGWYDGPPGAGQDGWPGGGTPYWPPQAPPPVPPLNPFAVVALVTSLACLAPLGLVFGVVALRQIARRGERGKGLAIAGLSVSGAVLLLAAVIFPTVDFRVWTPPARDDGGQVTEAGWTTLDRLEPGDCFTPRDALPEEGTPSLDDTSVRVVPCDRPHRAEAYASFALDDEGTFPGRERLTEAARPRCGELYLEYSLDPLAFGPLQTYFFHPDPSGWRDGWRTVLCWVTRPGGADLDFSVRRDAADLDPAQASLLTALKPLNVATVLQPARTPREDLAGATAWAGRMAEAQAETADLLKEADLPGAEEPADLLVAELEAGLPYWRAAARASDADAFLGELRSVREHTGSAHLTRVRELLDLPTPAAGGGQADGRVRYRAG
ncbi:DUF4190 domain-containing protein [Streptomyces sp. NPDC006997]|uniref:DUF4190 domain-containing protein n=1 Tax=Streptomyces sp. NPDC006997 TaxID=3155356 RepID=UPI0033E00E5E